jgi:hypothetical protein
MNQFFFESRAKEKVNELMKEGQNSQAFYRSGAPKLGLLHRLPKLIFILMGILGIFALLAR